MYPMLFAMLSRSGNQSDKRKPHPKRPKSTHSSQQQLIETKNFGQIRNPMLYPFELRAHWFDLILLGCFGTSNVPNSD